jgi:hypothetical protein
MKEHDKEQRQILGYVPSDRGVASLAVADFVGRHQEPGPMQKHVDAGSLEQMN